jgi:hypothetical protein
MRGSVVPLISRPPALTGAFLKAEQLPLPSQPLAEAAAVFLEQFDDFAGGFLVGPVTLQFADIGPGRYRGRPPRSRAGPPCRELHGWRHSMRRSESRLHSHRPRREHRHLQTHFRPKAGHHQLLLGGFFHPVHDPPVFPTVEGGTVERVCLGKTSWSSLIGFLRHCHHRCSCVLTHCSWHCVLCALTSAMVERLSCQVET